MYKSLPGGLVKSILGIIFLVSQIERSIKMRYLYKGCVISDLGAIGPFVEDRLSELSPVITDEDKLVDIRLILSELLINGAIHGNQSHIDKKVSLRIEIESNNMTVRVHDEGQGFDLQLKEYDPRKMLPSGRGLVLIKGLCKELILDKNRVYVKLEI